MRKYFGAMVALLLLAAPAFAQDTQRVPLAIAWDMDGEAADADQVVTAEIIVDSTALTIAAQPDTCRVINFTVVDTNMSAGTITVDGLDCWGDAQTCTWTATAGDDTGVQALTYGTGSGTECAFSSVTSVTPGVMAKQRLAEVLILSSAPQWSSRCSTTSAVLSPASESLSQW